MAERGSRIAGSDGGGSEDAGRGVASLTARPRRVVALRPTSGPGFAVAPAWATAADAPPAPGSRDRGASAAPGWAGPDGGEARPGGDAGGRGPAGRGLSASALAESVFPFGSELPFEPDAEAAAFLNAPRRPLDFHVAPFGTPPFGNPPTGPRSVFGGPVESGRGDDKPAWGPAYPAGA